MTAQRKYEFTAERRSLLRETYDSKPETITFLSNKWRVPRVTIKRWAQLEGLAQSRKYRPWTPKEDEYLRAQLRKSGRMKTLSITRALNRTATDVTTHAQRIRLEMQTDGYTLNMLAEAFGCGHHKIERWIAQGWLKGRRAKERNAWHFSERAVRRFIIHHPREINQHSIAWEWVVDILAGGDHGVGTFSEE